MAVRATCPHGAPWWRDDCPRCLSTAPRQVSGYAILGYDLSGNAPNPDEYGLGLCWLVVPEQKAIKEYLRIG